MGRQGMATRRNEINIAQRVLIHLKQVNVKYFDPSKSFAPTGSSLLAICAKLQCLRFGWDFGWHTTIRGRPAPTNLEQFQPCTTSRKW